MGTKAILGILLLFMMLLPLASAQAQGTPYLCSNGCSYVYVTGSAPSSWFDMGDLCEAVCCPGYLQAQTSAGVWATVQYNVIHCDSSLTWCADGITLYEPATQPIQLQCADVGTNYMINGSVTGSVCPNAVAAGYVTPDQDFETPEECQEWSAVETTTTPPPGTIQCSNGCSFLLANYDLENQEVPWYDSMGLCEVVCCPGYLQAQTAAGVWTTVPYNVAHCDTSLTWCVDGITLYQPATMPLQLQCVDIANGYMVNASIANSVCPNWATLTGNSPSDDSTPPQAWEFTTTMPTTTTETTTTETTTVPPIDTTTLATTTVPALDTTTLQTTTVPPLDTTTLETTTIPTTTLGITSTEGTTTLGTTEATTAGAVTSATTTVAPAATTTVAPAPTTVMPTTAPGSDTTAIFVSGPYGMCTPFVASDGITYDNRCVQIDTGAICNDDNTCTCSAGYTGNTCGVTTAQLGTVASLAGPNGNSTDVLGMISDSKNSGSSVFMSSMPSFLSFLTDDQMKNMSYEASDIIIDATFEGVKLDTNVAFTAFNDPSLGNCFTFNYYNATFHYRARMIGPRGGLTVVANVQPKEYLPFIDTMGINVYVTEIGAQIYVESNKILSRPGGRDNLILLRSTTQLIKDWKSTCATDKTAAQTYYFSGNYSVDGCYRSCYQDSVYASCGCMDPMYVRKDGIAACTFDKVNCIFNMTAKRGDPNTWPECHCPEPCYSQDYDIAYSRGSHTPKEICVLSGQKYNSSVDCTPSASVIRVAFSTLEARVQEEVETFPLSRVFANIGNVGGLLMGFSMVSLFELIFFLTVIMCICAGREDLAPTPGTGRHD